MTGKFLTQDANLFFSLSGLTSLFSDAIVISDGEWEEIPIEELTCKTPVPVPLDDLSKINRAVENLKKEGVQPYPGSDNFYPTTPPSTSRTVLHPYQPSHTVRSHGNASVKAVRYRTVTPQTILEAEQRPTAYAPPISQPPPPPAPSHARTDEQHSTAASISPPTPPPSPPPPPPPPSPAQEQSDSDSETAERGPEQPADEEEENAPPPAPVQKKRLKKKKNIRLSPLQRLNRMKMAYLLLQVNSGLVEVVQQVLAL
ncbi:uncharacterized protein [Nothobranchius furzeri]|uniref:uncharacterized protein isoform X3 n=1 Tax=Nothobranchius furzeri TaxID=105023 RepID=UPI003904644F